MGFIDGLTAEHSSSAVFLNQIKIIKLLQPSPDYALSEALSFFLGATLLHACMTSASAITP